MLCNHMYIITDEQRENEKKKEDATEDNRREGIEKEI